MSRETEEDDHVRYTNKLLIPLCTVCLMDAISFMVVAPSLVFYVVDVMGGTKEQYGIILSVFSFASFAFKPVLGFWSDKSGGKFRVPYFVSLAAAAIGGLVYFFASIFPSTCNNKVDANCTMAGLAVVFIGRLLGGMGAANSTLAYAYIARVVPHEQLTRVQSILASVRIGGMAFGPSLSVVLDKVHATISFGKLSVDITPLNSVGIALFLGNLGALLVVYSTLNEPHDRMKAESSNNEEVDERSWKFWKAALSLDILIPICIFYTLNANFQLLETALAPASYHALGWGPVDVSIVLSVNAALMFGLIYVAFLLSAWGVSDISLLVSGEAISVVGHTLLYLYWKADAPKWKFLLPCFLSIACLPFLVAPCRSVFTIMVNSKPYLRNHQGTMQALNSMSSSIAGFVAPALITAFVLRSPEEVDSSPDQRELTSWALMAPFTSFVCFLGVLHLRGKESALFGTAITTSETKSKDESTALINSIDKDRDYGGLERLSACHSEV